MNTSIGIRHTTRWSLHPPLFSTLLILAALLAACSPYHTTVTEDPTAGPQPDTGYASLFSPNASTTASTGETRFDWGYRFRKGEQLLMRRTWDQETRSSGSFIRVTDATVDVEDVDAAGNATLVITVTSERDLPRRTAPQHEKVRSYFAPTTPQVRVTIDRYGTMISGEILEEDEGRKQFREEIKKPGVNGHMISDEKLAELNAEYWFWPLTSRPAVAANERWNDTLVEQRTGQRISLSGNKSNVPAPGSGTGGRRPAEEFEYEEGEIRRYEILPDVRDERGEFHRVRRQDSSWQTSGSNRVFVWTGITEFLFADDGTPLWCRKRSSGGLDDSSTFIVTVEVLEVR